MCGVGACEVQLWALRERQLALAFAGGLLRDSMAQDALGIVDGTHGYLDSGDLVSGTHGYLDNGAGLGRAGLFFAGASIVFSASGFGFTTPGYLDWGGCVAFGALVGGGREVAVGLSKNAWTGLAPEAVS